VEETMEKKLEQFLDEVFAPYGDFPSRADITQELLVNLQERYEDLRKQGRSEDEAYRATIDSFGDVAEIMDQVPHGERKTAEPGFRKTPKKASRLAKAHRIGFSNADLKEADLRDSNLTGTDFCGSELSNASFDRSDLDGSKFRAAALKGASFDGADLTNAVFAGGDLRDVSFDGAKLTDATIKTSDLRGTTFAGATLDGTYFGHSDLREV